MTRHMLATLGRLLVLVVLAGSAVYVGLSMYRWEWQRAMFAGMVFLGALVLVATLVVVRRIEALERRLDRAAAGLPGGGGLPAAPPEPFAWLAPPTSGTYVFVPLLLGFGVLVSLVAMAVERLAGFVVGAPHQRWPAEPGGSPARRRQTRRTALLAGAALLGSLALAAVAAPVVTGLVYDPGTPTPGARTLEVRVEGRRVAVDAVSTVSALAIFCREQTRADVEIVAVAPVGPVTGTRGTALLTVRPRLAPPEERRYEGCLEDMVMDRHRTTVVAVRDVPVTPARPAAAG